MITKPEEFLSPTSAAMGQCSSSTSQRPDRPSAGLWRGQCHGLVGKRKRQNGYRTPGSIGWISHGSGGDFVRKRWEHHGGYFMIFHGANAANANDDLLGGFVRSPLFSLQWMWSFAAPLHWTCHVADAPRVAGGHVMVQNKQATYQTFWYQYLFWHSGIMFGILFGMCSGPGVASIRSWRKK